MVSYPRHPPTHAKTRDFFQAVQRMNAGIHRNGYLVFFFCFQFANVANAASCFSQMYWESGLERKMWGWGWGGLLCNLVFIRFKRIVQVLVEKGIQNPAVLQQGLRRVVWLGL